MYKKMVIIILCLLVTLSFSEFSYAEPIEKNKVWNVNFNTELNPDTVHDRTVLVKTSTGNSVDVSVSLTNNGRTIEIRPPAIGYKTGASYILHLNTEIKSSQGKSLETHLLYDFQINSANSGFNEWIKLEVPTHIDPYNMKISLSHFPFKGTDIDSVEIEKDGSTFFTPIDIHENTIFIRKHKNDILPKLALNENYQLKIYTQNGNRYLIDFHTSGFPELAPGKVIFIPAMPEEGFNFPYVIRIPNDSAKYKNLTTTRRLLVYPNNSGPSNDFTQTIAHTINEEVDSRLTHYLGDSLWIPLLTPIFPRYRARFEEGYFYTHALDRLSVTMDENMITRMKTDPQFQHDLNHFLLETEDFTAIQDIDEQLENMIDHAILHLNKQKQNIAEDKVFMTGFSATGNFTNRWAMLHPDRVKAVASGGINSQAMIPLAEIDGDKLIYPIGVADVKEFTGEPFNLDAYNKIANYMYQGELDQNDTYGSSDTFGSEEMQLIKDHLGETMYPNRWKKNKELFFKSGAKGMFGLYKGIGHSVPTEVINDLIQFFDANREDVPPVYPSFGDHVILDKGE